MKTIHALSLVLVCVLFITGSFLIAMSFHNYEKINSIRAYSVFNSWNITGYFEAGDILAFDIAAGKNWAESPLPDVEEFPVYINITVVTPDGGHVLFYCNYSASVQYSGSMNTVSLGIVERDVIELNTTYLEVSSLSTIGESEASMRIGQAKCGGNFTLIVDEKSVANNFISPNAPRRLWLSAYVCEHPYSYFLPWGCIFLVSSCVVFGVVFFSRLRSKRAKHHGFRR